MKNTLWTVVTVVAVFLGFFLGYSVSPMLEVGISAAKGEKTEVTTEMDQDMEEYYRDLLKDK